MKEVKSEGNEELSSKIALFGKTPDECLTCEKPFDKKDREQVMTWNVVVREQEEKVNLYCPSCWQKAVSLIKEMEERIEKRKLK